MISQRNSGAPKLVWIPGGFLVLQIPLTRKHAGPKAPMGKLIQGISSGGKGGREKEKKAFMPHFPITLQNTSDLV